jgi:hypothetical protein
MPFNSFPKSRLTLVKPNGDQVDGVQGIVAGSTIVIDDPSLPLEEGDHLERILPNGLVEVYLVHDRAFYEKAHGTSAHYQAKVRKLSTMEIERRQKQQNVISVKGDNSRVNINSTDNSSNTVGLAGEDFFAALAATINKDIANVQERARLVEAIEQMRSTQGKSGFLEGYQKFVASAANHMKIIAPFLPALMKYFPGGAS